MCVCVCCVCERENLRNTQGQNKRIEWRRRKKEGEEELGGQHSCWTIIRVIRIEIKFVIKTTNQSKRKEFF